MDWFIRKKRAVAPQAVATDLSAAGRSAEPAVAIAPEELIFGAGGGGAAARVPG